MPVQTSTIFCGEGRREEAEQGASDKVEERWVPLLVPLLFYGHCAATILVQPVSAIGRSDGIDSCTQDRKGGDNLRTMLPRPSPQPRARGCERRNGM